MSAMAAPAPRPTLIVRAPGRVAFRFELGGAASIGRAPDNDLVIADSQVSRRHARLALDGDRWVVTDLASTHGTLVNGQRIVEHRLVDGDVVQVGNALLFFRERPVAEAIERSVTAVEEPERGEGAEARRLHFLYDASRAIGAGADADAVAGKLLDGVLEVLCCGRGVIGLLEVGGALRRLGRSRAGGRPAEDLAVGKRVLDAMLVGRESLLVRDGDGTAMGAPLLAAGRAFGFIYVADPEPGSSLADADLDFLNALAHLAAAALTQARERRRLDDVAEALGDAQPLVDILGTSEVMRRLGERLQRFAQARDIAVLIRGESGTGKELVARTLHARSPRAAGPFVAVNCAAIPETLIESELFGHEKGAFTGAVKRRRGRFVVADGGTLFLDEIGDLSASAQAKVLRAIEEGEVQPVGAEAPVRVDVRVLSATHKDLTGEIAAGRFRSDLYYRLNVGELELPPLRARGDDALLLARTFLAQAAQRLGRRVDGFSAGAERTIARYGWPGNVRQLMNEVERAVVLADGSEVDMDDLLQRLDDAEAQRAAADPAAKTIEDAERQVIQRALHDHPGNIQAAARSLGVARGTLYRKLAKHKIDIG
jgi:DNA-binding NtrC family response regulator